MLTTALCLFECFFLSASCNYSCCSWIQFVGQFQLGRVVYFDCNKKVINLTYIVQLFQSERFIIYLLLLFKIYLFLCLFPSITVFVSSSSSSTKKL